MADIIICDSCGRGFLSWIPGGVDQDPIWQVGFNDVEHIEAGLCGGALVMLSRETAIEIADRFEKIGAEAWLKGQRRL